MSLISEALRKARRDAAEDRARQRGLRLPPRGGPRQQSRLVLGVALGIALSFLAAGLGGAVVYWFLGGGERNETGERSQGPGIAGVVESHPPAAAEPSQSAVKEPTATVVPVSQDRPSMIEMEASRELGQEALPPRGSERVDDGTMTRAVEVRTEIGRQENEPGSVPERAPGAVEGAVPDTEPVPPQAAPAERVFVVDADLGYATLNLGYLVYRSDQPFAQINGVDVIEGSIVAGFRVDRIERDSVHLSDDRGSVVLKVR